MPETSTLHPSSNILANELKLTEKSSTEQFSILKGTGVERISALVEDDTIALSNS